ncbi:hypothetical protein FRB90_008821 [Tulasnella sp. 427]|nr:hypothetical protein FRB90_008821 [Tulasnella sp. 427]
MSFTAHFQSLAITNGYGSQVPFSFTITVTVFTILGISIEAISLYLEVVGSSVAQDFRKTVTFGEPFGEVLLGLFWFATLIVVSKRQKMELVGGCLDHREIGYTANLGICHEWGACLFFVVIACLSLASWVTLNHAMKSRDLCIPVLQQYLQQRSQQKAQAQLAKQATAALSANPVTVPVTVAGPPAPLAQTIAEPPAAGPVKESSESTMASKLSGTRDSSAWAPSLPFHPTAASTSELGVITPPASPPPSTLPPWVRTSRIENSEDSATISSALPPLTSLENLPPAAGPTESQV